METTSSVPNIGGCGEYVLKVEKYLETCQMQGIEWEQISGSVKQLTFVEDDRVLFKIVVDGNNLQYLEEWEYDESQSIMRRFVPGTRQQPEKHIVRHFDKSGDFLMSRTLYGDEKYEVVEIGMNNPRLFTYTEYVPSTTRDLWHARGNVVIGAGIFDPMAEIIVFSMELLEFEPDDQGSHAKTDRGLIGYTYLVHMDRELVDLKIDPDASQLSIFFANLLARFRSLCH